jgi:hypothetical protein
MGRLYGTFKRVVHEKVLLSEHLKEAEIDSNSETAFEHN